MDDMWVRFSTDLIGRLSGPMRFRLVLQPLMAAFFAIRAGLADASAGKPPYFWDLFWHRANRMAILSDGWKSVGRVFILAIALDVIYQLYVLHYVYPIQSITVALILAIAPYLILRGPVNRVARAIRGASTHTPPGTHRHA